MEAPFSHEIMEPPFPYQSMWLYETGSNLIFCSFELCSTIVMRSTIALPKFILDFSRADFRLFRDKKSFRLGFTISLKMFLCAATATFSVQRC